MIDFGLCLILKSWAKIRLMRSIYGYQVKDKFQLATANPQSD